MKKRGISVLTYDDEVLLSLPSLVEKVVAENTRQIKKWGVQNMPLADWIAVLNEEVGEVSKQYLEATYGADSYEKIADEAIQVATIALKIAEICSIKSEGK